MRNFAAAFMDGVIALLGVLLGATAGGYFSARIAQAQQLAAADTSTGRAAALLTQSAKKFDLLAQASEVTTIGLIVLLFFVFIVRSARRS